jgi:hypothetical protein
MDKLLTRPSFTTIIILGNFLILGGTVWFGSYYYAGALGWGDSLDLFRSSQTIGEFISFWHTNINGRLGQTLLTSWFLPFRWAAPTPENFPWWLASSFALFCALFSPVHFILAIPSRTSHDWRFLLLIPLAWVVWTFNPVPFYNRQLFTLLELTGYSLPIYIVSVAVIFLYRTSTSFFAGRFAPLIMVFGGIVFSLLGEQYLLVTPVFVFGLTLSRVARGDFSSKVAFKMVGWTTIGVLTGFAIYWFAPGQAIRHELLKSLSPFSLWKFYEHPVINSYQMLFHLPQEIHPIVKTIILVTHSLLLLSAIVWAKGEFRKESTTSPWHGMGIFVATLLAAFHASFSTLLVAAYLPGYAYTFPLLLLTVALLLASIIVGYKIREVIVNPKAKLAVSTVGAIAILCLFLNVGVNNWRNNSETARLVEQNNQHREKAYGEILAQAKNQGASNFVVVNCPMAYPAFGWTMEPPWGISGYFAWQGYPSIHVFLQGNADFPPDWETGGYKVVKCLEN